MLATVAAADSASTVRKEYSVFIYSEAEPHAMYAIYKQMLTLCSTVVLFKAKHTKPSISKELTFSRTSGSFGAG